MSSLETTYDHKAYEKKWWDHWQKGGWFQADAKSTQPPFTVLIPPPNVTARLHMGHGLNNTIQDIIVRWKRMQGYNCCWLPGTDHAGIATQMMVEKDLIEKGMTRQKLGRNAFVKKCVEWKEVNGGVIIDQLKRLGASCDWSREAYTLNPKLSRAVRYLFVEMFDKGLIYRGKRLVNWDPVLKTAISDDEVVSQEVSGNLWSINYPLSDGSGYLTVATTRPETLFGDTAVAVHPRDERYTQLVGKFINIPIVGRKIPIIADPYVKSEFGTGCVKITPAHDPNDFAIGERHQLAAINIMNEDATLNDNCPKEFQNLDRFDARKKVVQSLKQLNLLEATEPTKHAVPYSERSKVPIEPRLSLQWYVKMKDLAQPAIDAAVSGELKFFPASWQKTYLHWLENIQDWCISRQLWWGHRIPIWYCSSCGGISTAIHDPLECAHCASKDIYQDEDVLDTWFSSWLWPLSPFGWPQETADLKAFFPSNVLVTAPEIIYLWVARMVILGLFTRASLPFKNVYFNATICDKQGRKFSKTLGNGIDPLKLIERYGADSVRYTCVSLAPLGGRVKLSESDFEGGHRFINKLWNAHRFLLGKIDRDETIEPLENERLDLPSKWLIHELKECSEQINRFLSSYQINEATETLFRLAWRVYCDWGLESAKESISTAERSQESPRGQSLSALVFVLEGVIRLASPFIPFLSEEIWHNLPHHPNWKRPESLVIAAYPRYEDIPDYQKEADEWRKIQTLICQVRSARTQAKVPPRDRLTIWIRSEGDFLSLVHHCEAWICSLAGVKEIRTGTNLSRPKQAIVAVGSCWTLFTPVGDYLDFQAERVRLQSEFSRIDKIVSNLRGKLESKNFLTRAPKEVVDKTRLQHDNMVGQLRSLKENLFAVDEDS